MANFIDFLKDSTEKPSLSKEFLSLISKEEPDKDAIMKFFKDNGYTLSDDEIAKLIQARDNIDDVLSGSVKY